MSHPTLLEMTQGILRKMESDNVSAIADTIEATDVANIIGDIYFTIIEEFDFEEIKTLDQLGSGTVTTDPTGCDVPDGMFNIENIFYDTRNASADARAYTPIAYKEPAEFLNLINGRDSTGTNIDTITGPGSVELLIQNDAHPSFWTSFDGGELIHFDAYKSSLDSTILASKTQVWSAARSDLTIADGTVIDLPVHLFSLLTWEATELCFDMFKGGAPRKIRRLATRSRVRAQRTGRRNTQRRDRAPDYGRPKP